MPISITRVYTRTGDKGETSLVGGKRIPKDSPRIVAYGTVDELNAVVGLVRVFNAERLDAGERHRWLDEVLRKIQNQLFDLGSELATPPDAVYDGMFRIGEAEVRELERLMDECLSSRSSCRAAGASTDFSIRRGRCAGAPSASSWRCRARSRSASGRSAS